MLVGLLLLLLLPIASATEDLNLPNPTESSSSHAPLVNSSYTSPVCQPTKWLDTFKKSSYVAVVDVVSSSHQSSGDWIITYREVHRYKGIKPLKLRTVRGPKLQSTRYIVSSTEDGMLYYCNVFALVDGGVPSGVPRYDVIEPIIIARLFDWSGDVNSSRFRSMPRNNQSNVIDSSV